MIPDGHLIKLEDYEVHIGAEAVERICRKAAGLRGLHVTHVNSTYYGGGVAELLGSLTLLMNSTGIRTGWRVIQGSPDFFSITKKMHNALQGGEINLSARKKKIYREVIYENAVRNHIARHDVVLVHDPQPLPLILHYPRRKGPWIWRCHIDLSRPHPGLWSFLQPFVDAYDAVVLTLPDYRQDLQTPQVFFEPSIDPFNLKNREMSSDEIEERLDRYSIPRDLPIVVQISRFDRWKDPDGVIKAFRLVRREMDATLVLLGNAATDDPEGQEVYQSLLESSDDRIIILSHQDSALVNALQRRAAVVVQKSLREGFGLTVTEAMWKGAAVVGGRAGGIERQIQDGINGLLVGSVEEAAAAILRLLRDEELRRRLGEAARESVRRNFLMSAYLEKYLDLFSSFETVYRLRDHRRTK